MRTSTKLALALVAGAIVASGCGGSDDSSEADQSAIVDRVQEINTAVRERDGETYCALLEPDTFLGASTPDASFDSRDQCATETDQILKQAGRQPALVVENIEIDGEDSALVSFTDRNGEASFVKVDGAWYLSLGAPETPITEATGATGPVGEDGG